MDKTEFKELKKKLLSTKKNGYDRISAADLAAMETYCGGYKKYLDIGKTERLCAAESIRMAEEKGYRPYVRGMELKTGDKVYVCNRGKALMLAHIGQKSLEEGAQIAAAHIDAPRLDLKPNPLYEESELAYFKTHYYGGIRKYQWATIPLAMHGVVVKKNGEVINICIGEEAGDPVFCISDLLPHLAAKQNERKLSEGIRGEELNIIVGSVPYTDDEVKEPVKLLALKLLNEKYGITEADFFRAEIEMVPAQKAADVGLDRSLVGAYGQDDRVCAYTALMAEIETKNPPYTTITVLADKEEIGSEGNTGMHSHFFSHYLEYLAQMQGVDPKDVYRNSMCLSADVNAAYDPTFSDVFEANNSSYVNKGCVLTKYTGARGKSGASDASAETMAKVIAIMEENGVYWQAGELGAVDQGGGGTIAKFVAQLNIDVVDLGVPIVSMHAPFELASKLDVYNTYKAFKAFYK